MARDSGIRLSGVRKMGRRTTTTTTRIMTTQPKFHFHWPTALLVVALSLGGLVTSQNAYDTDETAQPTISESVGFPICGPGGCSDNVGAADSCVACPFCDLQHGYCKDNCCAGGGIGPHICGMDGCMATEDGHLDFEQTVAAVRQFGEEAVRDLLDDLGIHTLVTDDGTHIDIRDEDELGKKTGCDCPFCAKNLGWPACYVCHSCEDEE